MVKYGQGIRRRYKGEGYGAKHIESCLQAAIVAVNAAEGKGVKSLSVGFQSVLPAWIPTLKKLGVDVKLFRKSDALDAAPRDAGDMDWHWKKVYEDFNDSWYVYEWRLSWTKLVDADDEADQEASGTKASG